MLIDWFRYLDPVVTPEDGVSKNARSATDSTFERE
jgi:hypothetical protein